ncbi:MAG: hypothetical protein RLZZ331_1860, partial [Pseudomonadota bacterium]
MGPERVKTGLQKAVYAFVLAIAPVGMAHAQPSTEESVISYTYKIRSAPRGAVDPADIDALNESQQSYISEIMNCRSNIVEENSESRQAVSRCKEEIASRRLDFLRSINIRTVSETENTDNADQAAKNEDGNLPLFRDENADLNNTLTPNDSIDNQTATVDSNENDKKENINEKIAGTATKSPHYSPKKQKGDNNSIGAFVFFIFIVLIFVLIWYLTSTASCSKCGTRIFRTGSRSDVLDKEVRFKTVTRHVRGSDGRKIRSYEETVPYN